MTEHICQDAFLGIDGMRGLCKRLGLIPTSTNADTVLIRSHVAYWAGHLAAERAEIRPSRGHSYRLKVQGSETIVRIADYYDHREGVTGWHTD